MAEESVQSTWEEASRCPKCGKPGEERRVMDAPPATRLPLGTKIHFIYCVTELCPWYNTPWQVQTNPDGSVPPPTNHRGQPKVWDGLQSKEGDDIIKNVIDNLRRQKQQQTEDHAEIRNPNAQ